MVNTSITHKQYYYAVNKSHISFCNMSLFFTYSQISIKNVLAKENHVPVLPQIGREFPPGCHYISRECRLIKKQLLKQKLHDRRSTDIDVCSYNLFLQGIEATLFIYRRYI